MVLLSIIITISYLILIGFFAFGFNKVSDFKLEDLSPKTQFSIIIPFRNESKQLPSLLKSIESLNYKKQLFEVIFVDDDSEDNSVEIIKEFFKENLLNSFKIIANHRTTNSPKKDAITSAINKAKNKWIITTDADCILPKYWLDSFDEFIQKNSTKCIVAPVKYYDHKNSFLKRFQILDLLSLQGATIGGFGIDKPFLCNGANFGYEKAVFKIVNGFEGNTEIASGDDIFLLEKIAKKYPKNIHYLKCEQAIIKTLPQPNWKSLFSQRIRWAAKTSAYKNTFGKLTGLLVLLMNVLIISISLLVVIGSFNAKILFYTLFLKLNIDFLLVYKSATFFKQKETLITFVFAFFIYPFFSTYVAFISIFKSYKWKGRTFKK